MHQRPQLGAVHDAALGVERLVVDLADDAELAQALDAHAVGIGQRAEARRVLGDQPDAAQRDIDRLGGLEDRADLAVAQQAAALALDLAERHQVLDGQRVGADVGPILGRHHADQRVGEEVDELQGALARQRVQRQVAQAPLPQGPDGLIEREAARQPDPHAVARDLLEEGRGRRPQLGLEVAPTAGDHHHRLPQPVGLGEPRLQALGAGKIQLDPDEPLVEGALEQPGDRGRRHPERARDVLLAAGLPVVQLQALHHEPDFPRRRLRN